MLYVLEDMAKHSIFVCTFLVSLATRNIEGFLDIPDSGISRITWPTLPTLAEPPLKIASFNIQVFGHSKYSKVDVRNVLVKILSQYDIVQVLEIRDSHGTVFGALCNDINAHMKALGVNVTYAHIESGRLGRTTSKEQYGFLFRTNHLSVVDTYQMSDPQDVFEREPFGVRFRSPTTVLNEFGMVALHLQPTSALEEMNQLPNIYKTFKEHWHMQDILISGDFNADCQYLSHDQWINVTARNHPDYDWLIDDITDTTVAPSLCSYDKFVATGQFARSVVPGSVKVFRFDEVMNMNKTEGLRISDHYPIELQLRGNPHTQTQEHLETRTSFTVKDTENVKDLSNVRNIYRTPSCAPAGFTTKVQMEQTHMDFVTASVADLTESEVMPKLMAFSANCTGVLSLNLLGMVDGYMKAQHLADSTPHVYGLVMSKSHSYGVEIKCWLVSPNVCEVTVSYKVSGP